MKKSTLFRILLPIIIVMVGITAKAQTISAIGDLNAATKAVYCPSDQVKITDQTNGSATYVWTRYTGTTVGSAGSGTTVTGQTTASMVDGTIPGPGYYTYVSSGTNANGCPSDPSEPILVYVLPNISVSINGSANACVSTVTSDILTATATNATASIPEVFAYTYQWYKGTIASSTLIPGETGSTYTLKASTDAGIGAENFFVKVKYVIKPACTEGTANPYTVTVEANPIKPVLIITP